MKTRTIVEYILAVVLVLMLGSLAGWYFFLRTQTETTIAQGIARGFGIAIPEGNAGGDAPGVSSRTGAGASPEQQTQRPAQLWQVEQGPVAGYAFVSAGGNLRLRYVERANGYVFEADPGTGLRTRVTNTLMPKIYEAFLSENGHVFERSVDPVGDITTFAGTISTSTDSSNASSPALMLLGSYLAKNIKSMSVNPVSGALFYIISGGSGGAAVIAEWDGQNRKALLESAILNWMPTVAEDGRIFLTQAAADGVPGYAYELKKDGTLTRLLGPVPGLVMRIRPRSKSAPDALLWSQSTRGELRLFARVGENATAVQIPVRTIADKCAWSTGSDIVAYCGVPQGSTGQNFLDNWYRGVAHSSDALWRIDASAGTAEMIYTPPSNTPLDIENVVLDRTGGYIAFRNAVDKSLWLFRLEQ